MILAHNLSSGNLKPSPQDHNISQKFIKAANAFDISIFDHLIVSEKRYFSFKDEKLIWILVYSQNYTSFDLYF